MGYPFLPNNHLRISHSSRMVLRSCKRKFQFRKFFEQAARHEREDNLKGELGKALHHGYQTFLSTPHMSMDDRVDNAIWEYMLKYPSEIPTTPLDKASIETGYATLVEMINAQAMIGMELAKIKCLDGEERYAIEVPFEILLEGFKLPGGVSVSLTGFIDAIFYDAVNKTYHVLDIKTSGRNSKDGDFSALYLFNEQCISYGFVLEYIQGRAIESFEEIYLHCKVDISEPKALKYNFIKTQEDIQFWYNSLLLDLMNIKTYMEMDFFPRDPSGESCFAFGSKCPYIEVCAYSNETAAQILAPAKDEKKELDEAVESKSGDDFKPWIKFSLQMPENVG